MTTIHNASLDSGVSSADLTVAALEPHGINAETDAEIYCKNGTELFHIATAAPGQGVIFYPTSDTLVVKNAGPAAGVIQITAK
jgi:hypothetical protein